MNSPTRQRSGLGALVALLILPAALEHPVRGEVVKLKTGQTVIGLVDRDGAMVQVYNPEGLWRVILRDTKIESIDSAGEPPRGERFQLVQPLIVHAGQMPEFAINVKSEPWDELGRRKFQFVGTKSGKPTEMTQAINELGPTSVRVRGVDGFWTGPLDIENVPKSVVLGLLAKVDQQNQSERLRVGRFLIQAEWYPEARAELDRIARDFPDLEETVATVKALVVESEARSAWAELQRRRDAHQPKTVLAALRSFPTEGAPEDVLTAVRNALRQAESTVEDERTLAEAVLATADALEPEARRRIEGRLLEILRVLTEAPDAVRERLEPFRKADAPLPAPRRFALIQSGWVLGAKGATDDPATADALWNARELVTTYLSATDPDARATTLEQLQAIRLPVNPGDETRALELPTLQAIVEHAGPPLRGESLVQAGKISRLRVFDDPNPQEPTEYAVALPPEYHQLREYPAIVVLHGPETPSESLEWLASRAAERGYILIAPEYALRDRRKAYQFSESEHAAAELAIRDASRRFSIDSNRVFLVGSLEGANMAWDFGLAHPELFAGVAVINGLPAKYVWADRTNAALVPMLIIAGDLAPAERELSFEQWARPLIVKNRDLIYIEYFRRGLEALPEEADRLFEWMSSRQRDPAPKEFEAVSARPCDARFYGVVIRSHSRGRATSPVAADMLGKNLKPAEVKFRANNVLNKAMLTTSGIAAMDVWISPLSFDFSQRIEVQVNGRTFFKGEADLTELSPYLEDLRIRGDRKQPYWLRVAIGSGRGS